MRREEEKGGREVAEVEGRAGRGGRRRWEGGRRREEGKGGRE